MSEPYDIASTPLIEGITLLEASAGTGKTYTIEGIYLRLILEKHLLPRDILTVTYTNAATAELKERIRFRLKSALDAIVKADFSCDAAVQSLQGQSEEDLLYLQRRLNKALQSFDEASIFTIHGFCQRILKEHAFSSARSFDAELNNQGSELFIQDLARDLWRQNFYLDNPLMAMCLGETLGGIEGLIYFLNKALVPLKFKLIPEQNTEDWFSFLRISENGLKEKLNALWELIENDQGKTTLLLEEKLKGNYRKTPLAWYSLLALSDDSRSRNSLILSKKALPLLEVLFPEVVAKGLKSKYADQVILNDYPIFDACQQLHEWITTLNRQFPCALLPLARKLLQEKKQAQNQMSFNDLLLFLDESLQAHPDLVKALKSRYQAVLIDEFQDTDPLQWNIFKTLFADEAHDFYLIGDPKQAIYGFRGADIFTYFTATNACQRQFSLSRNYRSAKALVEAVNILFSQREKVFRFDKINYERVDTPDDTECKTFRVDVETIHPAPMQLIGMGWDAELPWNFKNCHSAILRYLGNEIRRLLMTPGVRIGDRAVSPDDIAILVRKGSQGRDIVDSLRKQGIPVVMQSNESVFESAEAKEIELLLHCLLEPENSAYLRAFMLSPLGGRSFADLSKWDDDEAGWEIEVEAVQRLDRLWRDQGFIRMFQDLLYVQGGLSRLIQGERGERKVTNYLHLGELIHEAGQRQNFTPEELSSWFSRQIEDKERRDGDVSELRMESDEQAVQVITIHKSKGLQYPIVFCPYHWLQQNLKGKYLSYQDPQTREHCLCLDSFEKLENNTKALIKEEELGNEIRLLYVALTRAVARCYLMVPNIKNIGNTPLGFVMTPDGQELKKDNLVALANGSDGIIHFSSIEDDTEDAPSYRNTSVKCKKCHSHRRLSRPLETPLSFTSFSGLTHNLSEEVDFSKDEGYLEEELLLEEGVELLFPKGVKTGNYFHQLLETIEFHRPEGWPDEVRKLQGRFGFEKETQYEKTIEGLKRLMHRRLQTVDGHPFKLKDLNPARKAVEREFYFKMEHFDNAALLELQKLMGYKKHLSLTNNVLRGFMKGFIDLIFEYQGRYYILDWKTNYLGADIESYGLKNISEAIHAHHYDLQYHIYTVALDMALEQRIPNYNYERDFGGVYYLFIRGIMDSEDDSAYGVYYDCPTQKRIRGLRYLLTKGGNR